VEAQVLTSRCNSSCKGKKVRVRHKAYCEMHPGKHALLVLFEATGIMVSPRWTIPINMRERDKPVLDAALAIAKDDGSDITKVFRVALEEFVRTRARKDGRKLDEYFDDSKIPDRPYDRIFTPRELRN
jgi:hypothetical protein